MKAKKILSKNSHIPFGKHKGKTIEHIMTHDCKYLWWMYHNVEWVTLDKHAKADLYSHMGIAMPINDQPERALEFKLENGRLITNIPKKK